MVMLQKYIPRLAPPKVSGFGLLVFVGLLAMVPFNFFDSHVNWPESSILKTSLQEFVLNPVTSNLSGLLKIVGLLATLPLNLFISDIDWPESSIVQNGAIYDFIIVGGGTAGSALASKLSENGNWSTLLIEAGGNPPIQCSIPALQFLRIGSEYDYQYRAVDDHYTSQAMVDNAITYPAGKMLGGTNSLINFFYSQGSKGDYDNWARLGNNGWSWNDVKRYFLEFEKLNTDVLEKAPGLEADFGLNGQFGISSSKYPYEGFNGMLKDAYNELGVPEKNNYFSGNNAFGAGKLLVMSENGRRVTTATAFLVPAKDRSNLHVLKQAQVKKVVIENHKAVGVEVDNKKIYANKEIILTAGTIGTAQLLMLSGIGEKKELEKFGIETKVERKVGKHYQDHILLPIFFYGDAQYSVLETLTYFASQVSEYVGNNTGLLSSNLVSDFVFFFSEEKSEQPEFELVHLYSPAGSELAAISCNVGYKLPSHICNDVALYNLKHDLLVIHVVLLQTESHGEITLNSGDLNDQPNIKAGFFTNKKDLDKAVRGLRILNNLTETTAFKNKNYKLLPLKVEECADIELGTDEYWKCLALNQAATIYHPIGSAKMGEESDANAIVDNELKVYGVENMRIGDASIMPGQISGHTTSAVVMIAHKLADMIQKDYS